MSRTPLRATLVAILLFTTLNAGAPARAQSASAKQSESPRVYEVVDARKAEELCERGEGLSKQGDAGNALAVLSETVKLYRGVYLVARTPTPLSPPDSPATFRTEMAARLKRAPQCIELYTRLGGGGDASSFERSQVEALRAHALGLIESDTSRAVFFGPETDTRAVITYKPEPRFPRGERGHVTYVTVRLRAVLDAGGAVRDALILSETSDAFAESSIEAAKGVRFTPAVRNGRSVSQFITLEYNFRTR